MKKRIWIATAVVLGAAPVWAQPDNKGAMAPSDEIAVAELERAIGGRTTLELKFKGLTTEQVAEEVAKLSALPFAPPSGAMMANVPRAAGRQVIVPGVIVPGMPMSVQPEMEGAKWNGDVDKTDFWPALRQWGRAENVRLMGERDAVQKRQNEEKPPEYPKAAAGETEIAPEVIAEWQKKYNAWSQSRMAELQRFDPNRTLSASFDANAGTWKLSPGSQLVSGRAVNSWPCLVLATGFQRQQNMSIQEAEPQKKSAKNVTEKAAVKDTAATAPVLNNQGREVVAGGTLSDSLSLSLLVYAEPKLLERGKIRVQVDEARDEAGEDLLPDRGNNLRRAMPMESYSFYGGMDSGIRSSVSLLPRQAKSQKLAVLRGRVEIRYPMKLQEHEITNFDGPQKFNLNTDDLPVEAQFEPPHLEGGRFDFSSSVKLEADRGARRLLNNLNARLSRGERNAPSVGGMTMGMAGNIGDSSALSRTPLGQVLLPTTYTFIDSEGRTWIGSSGGATMKLSGPDGKPVPVTSPPTPPPDNFTYNERQLGSLQQAGTIIPNGARRLIGATTLTPDELAKVRFVKATFTTESDWRTLEVPFEFHDLPLPPR